MYTTVKYTGIQNVSTAHRHSHFLCRNELNKSFVTQTRSFQFANADEIESNLQLEFQLWILLLCISMANQWPSVMFFSSAGVINQVHFGESSYSTNANERSTQPEEKQSFSCKLWIFFNYYKFDRSISFLSASWILKYIGTPLSEITKCPWQ